MPAHAQPRPPLASRPRTVLALGLLVATLSTAALVQAPQTARASQVPAPVLTTVSPVVGASETAPSIAELSSSRIARVAAIRAKREAQRERAERRERQQAREARQRRQERRADARAAARAAKRAPSWTLPVSGAGWSAPFGESGSAWSSGYHTGQDFTAPSGTPVHAVGPGTITSAAYNGSYGNLVVITHPDGSESWYAHMSGFERTSGAVSAGDVIGYVGCTGNCSGNHVHLEYHPSGGDAADPLPWLRSNGAY